MAPLTLVIFSWRAKSEQDSQLQSELPPSLPQGSQPHNGSAGASPSKIDSGAKPGRDCGAAVPPLLKT